MGEVLRPKLPILKYVHDTRTKQTQIKQFSNYISYLFTLKEPAKKAEKRKAEAKPPAKKDENPAKRGRGRPKGSTKKGTTKAAKAPKAKVRFNVI